MNDTYIEIGKIVGRQDIARILGVDLKRVNRWIERRINTGFPPIITTVNRNEVYDIDAVLDWYGAWVRTRGGLGAREG